MNKNGSLSYCSDGKNEINGYLSITATNNQSPPSYTYLSLKVKSKKIIGSFIWDKTFLEKSCSKIVSLKLYENDGFTKLSNFGEIDVEIKKLEIFDVSPKKYSKFFKIVENNLYAIQSIDYEKVRIIQIIAKSSNCYILIELSIVNINDCSPKFITNYNLEIPENSEKNYFVSNLEAEDLDSTKLIYKLETEGVPFNLLSNGTLSTTKMLDYEVEKEFNIEVSVSDGTFIVKTNIFISVLDTDCNVYFFVFIN
jgi:hypothetical protein